MPFRLTRILDLALPVAGAGLMAYYDFCDLSCASLRGGFWGIDLKYIGILFMAVLLAAALCDSGARRSAVGFLRTLILSAAVGGEAYLIAFQIRNDVYCPFCLAFSACVLTLFALHAPRMDRRLMAAGAAAGLLWFLLFFTGDVLPLYPV